MIRGNRLLNRVKRHAETTTLFRQRDTAVPPTLAPSIPQATMHAGLEQLPLGEVVGLPPVAPPMPAPPDPLADTLITRPAPQQVPPQPAIQQTKEPTNQPAPSQPSPAPTEDDPVERRLSTIMRKHEEKRLAEEAAEAGTKTIDAERGETHPAANKTPPDISRQPKKDADRVADSEAPDTDNLVAAGRKAAARQHNQVVGRPESGNSPQLSKSAEPVESGVKEDKMQGTDSPTVGGVKSSVPAEALRKDAPVDKLSPDSAPVTAVSSQEVPPEKQTTDPDADVTKVGSPATTSPIQAIKVSSQEPPGVARPEDRPQSQNIEKMPIEDIKTGKPPLDTPATAVHTVTPHAASRDKPAPAAEIASQPPIVTHKSAVSGSPISRHLDSGPATKTPEPPHLEETTAGGGEPGIGVTPARPEETTAADEFRPGQMTDEIGLTPPARTPLQSAWPVERREAADIPPLPPVVEPILPRHTPENAQVASVLQAVAAERPSDSSVEIIPPRRPRPANAPTLIQRTPEPAKPAKPESKTRQPESVPTEIGSLPADLWELIGEAPPTVMRTAVSESRAESQRPTVSQQPTVAQQPTMPQTPVTETPAPGQSPAPQEQIQETPATDQAPTTDAPGETAESEGEANTNDESAGPDVDELARKVYGQLKRKLSVEWERMRGKK